MTGRKAITRAEVAAGLRRLLDAITAGELAAPAGTVNRLEGAWLAVGALAAGRTLDPDALLGRHAARDRARPVRPPA
jgi:hypothetical protein